MAEYKATNLRNVGIFGDGGVGKTSLAEAMLYGAGAIDRLGRVEDGSTVMDYDPDEMKRKISINCALAHFFWNKHKLNIIDTPGYANFVADIQGALRAIDIALVTIDASEGPKLQTEKVWQYCHEESVPRLLFLNKMDHDRADFFGLLQQMGSMLKGNLIPMQLPIGSGASFKGVVDILSMKSLIFGDSLDGRFNIGPAEGEIRVKAEEYREKIVEAVAELSDALLEKYLEEGSLSDDEVQKGIAGAILKGRIIPVACGSAIKNMGVQPSLDLIVDYFPAPAQMSPVGGVNPKTKQEESRGHKFEEPFSALVFKTVADPYFGKLTLFRVFSGTVQSDSVVLNAARGEKERIGQLYLMAGKNQTAVASLSAGDIGGIAKLKVTSTGDTLCDEKAPIVFKKIQFPEPVISYAIEPKSKADEEKVSNALARLCEEDVTLRIGRDPQTRELLVSGMGEVHLDVVVDRLKRKFGVEVDVKTPKVPYKETIRSSIKVQGKYKRQSGGRGQYGDTWLEIEPLPRGAGFEFVDKIVGGAIPRQYIPSVEKGLIEAMEKGILAGYPVVDVKVTLYDGSFHTVDSSDMAFKIAASLGFKKGIEQCDPVLLEPIMSMEVVVSEENVGEVIGDLNSKRGKIVGVDTRDKIQIIKTLVPMAEILRYAPALRSMTGGRGSFSLAFSHYEEVPTHISEKIIAQSKQEKEG